MFNQEGDAVMASEPSPYLDRSQAYAHPAKKRESRPSPLFNERVKGFGHYWELGVKGRFDKSGFRVGREHAWTQICKYCRRARFAVDGKKCVGKKI